MLIIYVYVTDKNFCISGEQVIRNVILDLLAWKPKKIITKSEKNIRTYVRKRDFFSSKSWIKNI